MTRGGRKGVSSRFPFSPTSFTRSRTPPSFVPPCQPRRASAINRGLTSYPSLLSSVPPSHASHVPSKGSLLLGEHGLHFVFDGLQLRKREGEGTGWGGRETGRDVRERNTKSKPFRSGLASLDTVTAVRLRLLPSRISALPPPCPSLNLIGSLVSHPPSLPPSLPISLPAFGYPCSEGRPSPPPISLPWPPRAAQGSCEPRLQGRMEEGRKIGRERGGEDTRTQAGRSGKRKMAQ